VRLVVLATVFALAGLMTAAAAVADETFSDSIGDQVDTMA
jgi:hypothetical protein